MLKCRKEGVEFGRRRRKTSWIRSWMRRCNDCRINKKSAVKQQQKVAGITNTNSSSNKNNYAAGRWGR